MKEHRYSVYIFANAPRNFYVGFTSGLRKRVWEHKTKAIDCFTNSWHDCRLVYFESFQDVHRAIAREKQIKRWRREKKVFLIESVNRDWHDLSAEWFEEPQKSKAMSLDSGA